MGVCEIYGSYEIYGAYKSGSCAYKNACISLNTRVNWHPYYLKCMQLGDGAAPSTCGENLERLKFNCNGKKNS